MEKKKEQILMILMVGIFIGAITMISYAAFNYSRQGEQINTITTGVISMSYIESSNIISIDKALPTTDATGMVRLNEGEYFDFTVSSTIQGTTNINFEIAAEDFDTNTFSGSNIKYYLTKVNADGSETEVMAPRVYSEESESNEYTGRPSGMMSLYIGSMSASTTTNYRLRLYVDEDYNPQGDGGGLIYKTRINVYGKTGEKYMSPAARTILANNPVQEEKTNMFNYASNGYYYDTTTDDQSTEANSEYITNGLYSREDEDGLSYYFRGEVDNIVQFGAYQNDYYVYRINNRDFASLESCQSYNSSCSETNKILKYAKGTPMYWKIVRINGDGSLRLLYNGTSADATGAEVTIGCSAYNIASKDPKYTGYTYDNGTDSTIKKTIDSWYQTSFSGSSYDSKVVNGRFCSDSSNYHNDSNFGNIFASYNRLITPIKSGTGNVAPTLICPVTSESYGGSYRLKAGLLTADEMVLGGETMVVTNEHAYLYDGAGEIGYWSMTPALFRVNLARVWYVFDSFDYDFVGSNPLSARPVINLNTGIRITAGSGTASDPYIIE